nr:hypothetical protein [Saprospiraceae bacterium]
MRYFFLLLGIPLLTIGCQKDDDFPTTDGDHLVQYFESWGSGFRDYTYSYDELGNLARFQANINDEFFGEVEYFYDSENQLIEHINTSPFVDSLRGKSKYVYDSEGRMQELIGYTSKDFGMTFRETGRGLKFHYDEQGNLYRREDLFKDTSATPSTWAYAGINIFYEWEDGNIIKEEYYNAEGVKALTMLYKYDNKVNFRKDLPPYITWPLYQTRNNIIRKRYIDHLGHYPSVICKDCTYKYHYNRSGKPVRYYNTAEKERMFTLTYE